MKRLGFDLVLLGAPASGKDTQAKLLMKTYLMSPVETGKQWRKMVKKNDFWGKWLQRTFALGHPAPVAIVKWFLKSKVKSPPKNKDFIFIGNPRLKPEAQFLAKLLRERKRDFYALFITLPDRQVVARSLGRVRMQKEADGQYIKNRINFTKKQVTKTVAYFEKLGKMKKINGNQPISKVASDINKAINDYQRSRGN